MVVVKEDFRVPSSCDSNNELKVSRKSAKTCALAIDSKLADNNASATVVVRNFIVFEF